MIPLEVVGDTASVAGALSPYVAEDGAASVISSSDLADAARASVGYAAVSTTDAETTSTSASPAASDSSTLGDSVTTGSGDDAFSDAAVIMAKRCLAVDNASASAGLVVIGAGCGIGKCIIATPGRDTSSES